MHQSQVPLVSSRSASKGPSGTLLQPRATIRRSLLPSEYRQCSGISGGVTHSSWPSPCDLSFWAHRASSHSISEKPYSRRQKATLEYDVCQRFHEESKTAPRRGCQEGRQTGGRAAGRLANPSTKHTRPPDIMGMVGNRTFSDRQCLHPPALGDGCSGFVYVALHGEGSGNCRLIRPAETTSEEQHNPPLSRDSAHWEKQKKALLPRGVGDGV